MTQIKRIDADKHEKDLRKSAISASFAFHECEGGEGLNGIFAQLETVLDQLRSRERARQRVNIFFRDDDVDEDEISLRVLLKLFLDHEIPINLEIIPGRLTPPAVALLRERHDRRPDLIELNQHGWQHINHEAEGRRCEFGPSRSYDQQLADTALGRRVLEDAFGSSFSAVFTPPWNRCTDDTFAALDYLGFKALSKIRGEREVTGYSFRELSVTLDLFRWKGSVSMKSPEELIGELVSQIQTLETIGILLHHKVMDEAAWEFLAALLGELRNSEVVDFHTFGSLV